MRDIEKYEQDYIKSDFEDYQAMYRRKKILDILTRYKPKRILDIGCGTEPLFPYIDFDYDLYVIVEPSQMFINNAKKIAGNDSRIVCCQECFAATDTLIKEKFDFVICSSLLHELEKPMEMLEEIVKVCGNDTVVHITVPNAMSFHRLLAKEMGLIEEVYDMSDRNKLLQQHSVYDIELLRRSIEQVGLKEIESGSYFLKPFTHGQMYQMMNNNIINEQVLNGLYKMERYMPDFGSEIYVNAQMM